MRRINLERARASVGTHSEAFSTRNTLTLANDVSGTNQQRHHVGGGRKEGRKRRGVERRGEEKANDMDDETRFLLRVWWSR